jgi:hypothetical protein
MDGFLEPLNDLFSSQSSNSSNTSARKKQKITAADRQRVLQEEHAQLSLVLSHPQFQADPLTTIQTHLSNSLQLHRI